jgi:cobalt/nickel transport system permease protein
MAHIHLEDGAFTLPWVIIWYIIAGLFLLLCLYWIRRKGIVDNRTIVMAAMVTAAAFAIFQVNIPIFGGVHMNLTPLIGILAGPAFGGVIVLIVNILSAAIGHGGWGLIGANVLVNMTEVLTAYLVFRWLGSLKLDIFSRAGLATLVGLLLGNCAMVFIIVISGVQGTSQSQVDTLYGLALLAAVNMGVAIIESIITGFTVDYIHRVRPDMLGGAIVARK